tara:strand:+ start:107 stop:376 length:270 start_codon:yes stop_codon:yes gene_type:complete
MNDQHILNLLKIHNKLLDIYNNSFDGYILKETFKNEEAYILRDQIKDRTKQAISNLQSALSKLGYEFEASEIISDLTTKYSLKEKKNVQ